MSRRRRRWLLAPCGAAVIAAGGWLLASFPRDSEVSWVEARVDDLVIGVEIEGSLQSRDSSLLGPPAVADTWDYKISFLVPEGEEVEAGTPVLGFDTAELERRLRKRQTVSEEAAKKIEQLTKELVRQRVADELKLAEAQARARKARLKVDVPAELEKGQVLEEAHLDLELAEIEIAYLERRLDSTDRSGEAALEVLRSKKGRADQQVRQIQDGIARMTVKAPRSGKTIHVSNWQGEKKQVGDSCWRGQPVIELADLNSMTAKGEVDEADAGMIRQGQAFRVRLDAHPDVEYTGHVASIWQTVQRKSWRNPIKVVRLEMDLNETDPRRMRPGMRFRGNVEIERVEEVLVVPSHAVFLTPRGPVVFRRTLFGHEKVPVKLGRRNDDVVQVVEGLEPGDRIAERNLDLRKRAG